MKVGKYRFWIRVYLIFLISYDSGTDNIFSKDMAAKLPAIKLVLDHHSKIVGRLCLQISQQLTTLEKIRSTLPKDLADHAIHCVCKDKKLILYTDSANWASQLRFFSDKMLSAVALSTSAATLQVKIIATSSDTKPKRKALIPSQSVADGILQQSQISADPQLKQALGRLSATLTRLRAKVVA